MRQATTIILAATILSMTSVASADVIRGATQIIRNDLGEGAGSQIANYINQSGLETGYVSGVTDFAVYDPASVANLGLGSESWFGIEFEDGFTDFDLGVSEVVTQMATWTFAQSTDNQTGVIEVYVSDDPTFSGAGLAGLFLINDNASGGEALGQVLDLTDTQGRYVRIHHMLSQGGTFLGGSEVAFATASPIPEPLAASALWFALSGLVWTSRRRRSRS